MPEGDAAATLAVGNERSIETPDYFHCITDSRLRNSVYEPEADTFLFLDALDIDAEILRAAAPRRCLEVGCGSGTVITHLAQILLPRASLVETGDFARSCPSMIFFSGVDVNPVALEATAMTWERTFVQSGCKLTAVPGAMYEPRDITNGTFHGSLSLHEGDLFSPFCSATSGAVAGPPFDVVLFNPPYVPTSQSELDSAIAKQDLITAAWCGGPKGRIVIDRFLMGLPRVLSPCGGRCYIVAIRENDVEDIQRVAREAFAAQHDLIATASHGGGDDLETAGIPSSFTNVDISTVVSRYTGEHLCVLRITTNRVGLSVQ